MSGVNAGIQVNRIDGFPALKLICAHTITDHDLHAAAQEILAVLEEATTPVHMVIDLTARPEFPVGTTTYELLTGPVGHPKVGETLVFGSSPTAHLVEDFVVFRGGQDAHWFDTEAEAMAYLDQISAAQD